MHHVYESDRRQHLRCLRRSQPYPSYISSNIPTWDSYYLKYNKSNTIRLVFENQDCESCHYIFHVLFLQSIFHTHRAAYGLSRGGRQSYCVLTMHLVSLQ